MFMEDLWPRQSVHGWVLFLGIKSVYNGYKQQKWKKKPRHLITEASASVRLLLATAVRLGIRWIRSMINPAVCWIQGRGKVNKRWNCVQQVSLSDEFWP